MRKRIDLYKLSGALFLLGMILFISMPVEAAVTQSDLANPIVDKETHNQRGPEKTYWGAHATTYQYVYFGNYPQREIKGDELTQEIINATYDEYGNGEVNGRKIRRLSAELLTSYGCINNITSLFNERSTDGYRYFFYEPIKWRIYSNDGSTLFLVSDKAVDLQMYDTYMGINMTHWADCDLRSWLNYNGGEPEVSIGKGYHFKNPGFMYYAFSEDEKSRIQLTQVKQDCNPVYEDFDGNPVSSGEDTEDRIFILSYSEIANLDYGTCDDFGYGCTAAWFKNTDYSSSMSKDGCQGERKYSTFFWLRTAGEDSLFPGIMYICSIDRGKTYYQGFVPYQDTVYVVPALNASYTLDDCIEVSFQTNTDATIEKQILLGSNYAVEPDQLIRSGYEFTGWYLDKTCTKPYLFDEKLKQDTTLYAGWMKIQNAPTGVTGGVMKIQGTTSAMEYISATSTDAVWMPCEDGNTVVPTEGTWYVRYKGTDKALVSEAVAVNVISVDQATANYIAENNIPESTVAITDEVILSKENDKDIAGSTYSLLQAKTAKTSKKSVKLKWNRISGADGYEIYGARCNVSKKKYKFKLIKTVKQGNKKSYTYTKKNLVKGTYYKYIVRAYKEIEGKKITIAVSKCIHATTTGGKYGNAKSIKIKTDKKLKKQKGSYALSIKKEKKYTIKASEVKQSKKIRKHRAVAYESSNTEIATVSKKGVVVGKKKGTCYIYAYAQNGICAKIKVKVK